MQDSFKDTNGNIVQAVVDVNGKVPVSIGPFDHRNILTLNTFVLKTEAGVLHSVVFNTPVATGVIKIYDNNEAGGPIIATVTSPTSPQNCTLVYDVAFTGGLTIVSSVTAQDITVTYK